MDQEASSHIRDHMATHHPDRVADVLDSFNIRRIKSAPSALSRQIREAVDISQDASHCLLKRKEEYSWCILPAIRMEGPPPIKEQ